MKNVVQFTQEDLDGLIAQNLSDDGLKVVPAQYTITYVTGADGKTSALVTGVVKEAAPEEDAVPAGLLEDIPLGLERSARVALQVVLTFKPQTQETLVKKVLETLIQASGGQPSSPTYVERLGGTINAFVITALQEGVNEGKLVYVDAIDSWHKKRLSKTLDAAQAAADVLGGSGGVMDRSAALGSGVAGNGRRGH